MTCSKISSSDSVAFVEGNEDLLIEILLFLPAKPLVKFKAVSKKWSSLISSPCFCRRHTIHHYHRRPETQHTFIVGSGRSAGSTYRVCNPTVPRLIEVEFDLGFPHVEILQSRNGLLLLRCRRTSSGRNHYYVFNPTTMQRRDLPPLPFTSVSGTYLIFDPSLSLHYTVVCFVYAKTSTLVYLYDSEIHEWKLEDERMPTVTHFYDGIYFSGGINFLRFTSSYRFTPDDNLTKIPPLPQIRSCGGKRSYAHSNGALVFFLRQDRNVYHVCEMKEIESGWTNKYEVDMKPILDRKSNIRDINLLCVIAGEKEEDLLSVLMKGWKLMAYRFHEAVFEVLADLKAFCRDDEGPYLFRNAHHFIQTLALV